MLVEFGGEAIKSPTFVSFGSSPTKLAGFVGEAQPTNNGPPKVQAREYENVLRLSPIELVIVRSL
jgi:hypothetical protein